MIGCEELALELEPYYDRGSGGCGEDRRFVKHKLTKQAHSKGCTSEIVANAKRHCHDLFTSCGLNPAVVCDAIVCPNRLSFIHPDEWLLEWKDQWFRETENQSRIGLIGITVVIGLVVWYGMIIGAWMSACSSYGKRQNSAGRRLLNNKSAKSANSWGITAKTKRSKIE